MRVPSRRAGVLALMLLSTGGLFAAEKPTRQETARWAAGLNAGSDAGRDWMQRNRAAIGKLIEPVVRGCLPEGGEEVTAFSVFIRLSREGRVREILTDVHESLDSCLNAGSRELQYPQPSRDDYWIQVNLAAPM